ncbi:MAG: NAD-binding protein [Deltaproteobacteria bacterium]|jgi:2-hydroxy-3-oxopropionate reductase|nr:NAD-binding protein [Deltaproteobacteria bacterium]MBT4266839.1 NAD-binding protein [Deltaproteobacteria bacterium]MBT4640846.1 NAD-binding protein [Deltaproteobacteria bacterium]MBT6502367.1 NAD-binding protein [Deltaproteobacteria bacterium]MBT6615818.1 NAD-binding protein [Deltaproteobacteria bacterium]
MIETIGFIGLGIMGKPMATNLIKGGYQLRLYDVVPEVVASFQDKGAFAATSPADAADEVDAVISILPSDAIVETVALGENGVADTLKSGGIYVDMSTLSPATPRGISEKLKQKDIEMLDAPVSGGDIGAAEATLAIMVGGGKEAFDTMLPVFQKMGQNINYIGESGAGQIAKCANQIIVAQTIEAVSEALLLAEKAGVDPAKVRQALLGGFAQSRVLEVHGQRMLDRNFEPGGRVSIHKKDTEIAMQIAAEIGLYLPGTALTSQLWNAATAQAGGSEWDHSGILKLLEMLSGAKVASGNCS